MTQVKDFTRTELFWEGKWQRPRSTGQLELISPSTEDFIGRVPDAHEADVDSAVRSARSALAPDSEWANLSQAGRAEAIERLAAALQARDQQIKELLGHELGRPVHLPPRPNRAAEILRYYAALTRGRETEQRRPSPDPRPPGAVQSSRVRYEPVGVTAAIAPYNGTLEMGLYKVGPALATGGSVVFKPSPQAPLEAYHLAEAALEAGVPPGVINIVTGGARTGRALVEHPGTDLVAFTGSTNTGRVIAESCGRALKPVVLELGGKSAALVLEDADLDHFHRMVPYLGFTFAGQNCFIHSRILAPRSRYEEVVDAVVSAARSIVVGDPFAPETRMGPLISAEHRDRVEGMIRTGREEGAVVATGGGRPEHLSRGWYLEPTVFAHADNRMSISREEVFGPVVVVIPYQDEEEAVALANDSEYGLAGSVWTTDPARGEALAARVDSGSVGVNTYGFNSAAPLWGRRASGLGGELGPESLHTYTRYQSLHLPGV
ncbi:MAG TPA: aldehyde dehydrogenase family protein [Candidatus Nocardiopsis merdipullorum]|nr:aldehyde dehydrogenase family protein [Candidatus Nocardiopsis merdipullorum]